MQTLILKIEDKIFQKTNMENIKYPEFLNTEEKYNLYEKMGTDCYV